MRYHYYNEAAGKDQYGEEYYCEHPIYNRCTLFRDGKKGLAIIQQRAFDKMTYWDSIDEGLSDMLYMHPKFKTYFDLHAKEPEKGIFPTVTIRQAMWALRMKPLPRERWETYFDRPEV